ncbi:unnamed protein product [Calypogeia fissa]
MAAATTCASTSLAGQALGLSSNALAGKVNVGEARLSVKAKAADRVWYDADPDGYEWDTPLDFPLTQRTSPRIE